MDIFGLQAHIALNMDEFVRGVKSAVQAGKTVAAGLSAVKQKAAEVQNAVSKSADAMEHSADESGNLGKKLSGVADQEGVAAHSAADLTKGFENVQKVSKGLITAVDSFAKRLINGKTSSDAVSKSVEEQREKLESLKSRYADVAASQGKHSAEARKLAGEIKSVSGELNKNEQILEKAKQGADKFDKTIKDTGDDTEKAGDQADGASGKLSNLAGILGKGLVAGAKAAAAGIAAAVTGISVLAKNALQGYAEYEQLVGGVETLFGTGGKSLEEYAASVGKSTTAVSAEYKQLELAQKTVMTNAAKAYRTAGLSANEYMETATSFSAALIQGLNGDTKKAADVTDMAIQDMSDNMNKMGSSMESIQNAYQGFAKQNYTMLDNLKLGYGGTKTEMERLLADAQEISGVKYDISNLSDVYEAIHVIQTEMGITGTTSKEAASTIQGSVGMVKSAWSNLVTSLGDENADFGLLISELVDSAMIAADNIIPRIEIIIDNIATAVTTIAPKIAEKLPQIISRILPPMIAAATQLITSISQQLPMLLQAVLPSLISGVTQVLSALVGQLPAVLTIISDAMPLLIDAILTILPELITTGLTLIAQLAFGIADALPTLIPTIVDVVLQIVDTLIDNIDLLIDAAIALIMGLADGLIQALPILLQKAPDIITKLVNALVDKAPDLLLAAIELVAELANGILMNLGKILAAGGQIILSLADGIWGAISTVIDACKGVGEEIGLTIYDFIHGASEWGKDLIDNFVGGIKKKIQAVTDVCTRIAGKIKSFLGFSEPDEGPLSDFHTYAPDMMKLFADGIGQNEGLISGKMQALASTVANLTRGLKDTAVNIWTSMQNGISGIVDRIKSFISAAWDGIKSTTSAVLGVIGQTVSNSLNAVRNTVATIINAVRSVISSVLNAIQTTVSNIWNNIRNAISNAMNAIRTNISNIWNSVKSAVSGAITGIRTTIVNGFESAVDYIKSLPSQALQWGKDIIGGIVNGIKSKVSAVTDAVSGVAGKIKSFLHFSVPDEGPLTDYESWMPDFMKGLAGSIDRSRYMVQDAIERVAESMQISATAEPGGVNAASGSAPANDTVIRQNSTTVSYAGANLNVYVNGATAEDRQYGNNLAEQIAEALARLTSDNNARMGALA